MESMTARWEVYREVSSPLIAGQRADLKQEQDLRRVRSMLCALGISALVVAGVLFYVWQQVQQVRISYELEDLRAVRKEVVETNRDLKLEMATLRSLARVERQARSRLGLEPPGRDQVHLARDFEEGNPGNKSAWMAWNEAAQRRGQRLQ